MEYRTLGRTGLTVSEIGYGAWGIGASNWIGAKEEESVAALHRAIELGVNFIDTARGYGESERIVGAVMRRARMAGIRAASDAGAHGSARGIGGPRRAVGVVAPTGVCPRPWVQLRREGRGKHRRERARLHSGRRSRTVTAPDVAVQPHARQRAPRCACPRIAQRRLKSRLRSNRVDGRPRLVRCRRPSSGLRDTGNAVLSAGGHSGTGTVRS